MIIHLSSLPAGDHIVTEIYTGTTPANLRVRGVLSLDLSEWQLFGTALMLGADHIPNHHLRVTSTGDPQVVDHFDRRDNPPRDHTPPHPQ